MVVFSSLLLVIGYLLSLGVISVTAFLAGKRILRRLRFASLAEEIGICITLGLGVIACGIMLLGLAGLLKLPVVLVSLMVTYLISIRVAEETLTRLRQGWRNRSDRRGWLTRVVLVLVLAPIILLALYPPSEFDETLYHLPYAKTFIDQGRLCFIPTLRFPVFPQLNEMLFALGMLLSGDIVARLTQTLALLLIVSLLLAWGKSSFSRAAGQLAAALWIGNPLAVYLGTCAYVDVGLTLYVTAAFHAWERWHRDGHGTWLRLAGFFAGCAASGKYLGLFFVAAIGLMTAVTCLGKRRMRPLLTFGLVAMLVMAPWYGRIIYYTGSPVFPFYSVLFGTSEWSPELVDAPDTGTAQDRDPSLPAFVKSQAERITSSLGNLILLPWRGVFEREVFNLQAPLSPFYLVLLPLLGPFALAMSGPRRYLLLTAAYGLFWLTTIQDLRFFLPVLPVLGLALSAALARLVSAPAVVRRLPRSHMVSRALIVLMLAPGPLYAGYKILEQGPLPLGTRQREQYLARQVAGYPALAYLNHSHGEDYTVYNLWGEYLVYHADGRFLGDIYGPNRFTQVAPLLRRDDNALYDKLRSLGVDYLLILRHHRPFELPDTDGIQRSFRIVESTDDYILLALVHPPGWAGVGEGAEKAAPPSGRDGKPVTE
jgi:4-amino-4-deoxy-L-arabinose transferase-like glycosyltransferase